MIEYYSGMFSLGDRVLYRQPERIHSVFMSPNSTYEGTIISKFFTGGRYVYRIRLDLRWGDKPCSHSKYPFDNVIVGNITEEYLKKI